MPDIVLDYHRKKIPIDHPNLSITRSKLEYPTENVSFAYLSSIDKAVPGYYYISINNKWGSCLLTLDQFTDKCVAGAFTVYSGHDAILVRLVDPTSFYAQTVENYGKCDRITKMINGTKTVLASEEVVYVDYYMYLRAFSVSGSTFKIFRDRNEDEAPIYKDLNEFISNIPNINPRTTATDTEIAQGRFGVTVNRDYGWIYTLTSYSARLLPPASKSLPAKAVLEVDVEGSGKAGDPYRPKIPEGVSWGAFEFHPSKASSVVVTVFNGGNIQNVNAKRVFKPPKDYGEATDLHKQLVRDHPEWLAGKDNFIYQCLGLEVFEYFGNIDFYYGELLEHKTHYQQLKNVNPYEIERRLNKLIDGLSGVSVLTEERDKHISKAKEILRRGW